MEVEVTIKHNQEKKRYLKRQVSLQDHDDVFINKK